ncbi:MAG: hypothetical protein JWM99_5214, partial [Verrucomicrobiales bacterium]|nr:hypothetical protein [Verrucomicrobiales bacterium]
DGWELFVDSRRRSASLTELLLGPYSRCPPFHRVKRWKVCLWLRLPRVVSLSARNKRWAIRMKPASGFSNWKSADVRCDLRKRLSPFSPRSPGHPPSSFFVSFRKVRGPISPDPHPPKKTSTPFSAYFAWSVVIPNWK